MYFSLIKKYRTSPAFAMTLSSSKRCRSCPLRPGVAESGARSSLQRNAWFPRPPAPPRAATHCTPCSSNDTTSSSFSCTNVPAGTWTQINGYEKHHNCNYKASDTLAEYVKKPCCYFIKWFIHSGRELLFPVLSGFCLEWVPKAILVTSKKAFCHHNGILGKKCNIRAGSVSVQI